MNKSPQELARIFTDKYLTGAGSKALATMKITMMFSDSTTDSASLADALLKIGQAFPKNDEKIMESVNRLYLEFLKRK